MFDFVLSTLGQLAVNRVKSELAKQGKIVSGETAESVRYVIDEKGLEVRAKASIMTLVRGRNPTKNKGDGEVFRKIKKWCEAKGIDVRFAYAITKKIHEQGIDVPNKYTDGKLLENAFADFETEIKKELKNGYTIYR